ncbi:hypothetical protein AHAS_Ahas03G0241500 [Arachis hypogaea]
MFTKYKWSSTHLMVKQNFMGYHPPSPISNDGWEYHQENTHSEHSNSWRFASETQDEQENHMRYFLLPQNNASHDSNGGWEGNSNAPYDIHPKISSLDHASTESLFQNSPPTQTSMNQSLSKLETMFEKYEREAQISWNEQENSFKNMEIMLAQVVSATRKEEGPDEEASVSSKISMKKEVVEIFEPETALEMTREPEHSQPSQTSLDQNTSTLESMIERYEEEMKKAWEDQQTSSMKELLKQMLSVKEEGEEQASEEDNQERPNSRETERLMKDKLIEPPIQKALDEDQTPKITQQPCLDIQEVKATNKSTNSVPKLASKINQAICKRKLDEERPRQGTKAETSPPLKSFLLTNWKKRKKVKNNMSS